MPRDSHFSEFQDHTRLKHFLLDAYLKRWATILATRLKRPGKRGPRLWFVDAFAGAGRDSTGAPGSPVIASEIAMAINRDHFASPLGRDEGMRVIATEADSKRFEQLKENLSPFPCAHPRPGALGSILQPLLEHVRGDPVFFFLDPFGVGGLDAALLPSILQGLRTEILVLFSDEGAVRLAGKATASIPSRDELLASRQRNPTMFGEDYDAQIEQQDRAAVERVLSGHQSNPRALEILNTAFGGDWWREIIDATPVSGRQQRFVSLYEQVLRRSGATHVLNFAVTTGSGRHKYTLLHASKNERAFAAMKDAMHRTRRELPASATSPSLFDQQETADTSPMFSSTNSNIETVANEVARHFAGRAVRWSGDGYNDEVVKHFARDKTPLFPHEYSHLKDELVRRGYGERTVDGKVASPLRFMFPQESTEAGDSRTG